MKKLEIGCGRRLTPGYDGLDVRNIPGIKYPGIDARKLPIEDNSYDEIFAHWVLEHFAWREMIILLKEWRRVLKPGGFLRIVTNNQEAHNKCLAEGKITWKEWVLLTYGIHGEEELEDWIPFEPDVYECHKIGFTVEILERFLVMAGFAQIKIKAQWQCREANGEIKCPGLIANARKSI